MAIRTKGSDMKPKINDTEFGSITIGNEKFEHDVLVHLDGKVSKRKKKLSKAVFGTSHLLSLDEAEYVYEKGAHLVIIGAGQYSALKLSEEAETFFKAKHCNVVLLATPEAIKAWNNEHEQNVIGLFHVTC
jgi:hypothetical protein